MNRIVLIGNGFDLAHGMPTRYNDFLLWYIKFAFNYASTNTFNSKLFLVSLSTDVIKEGI
ncbi:AbiH family protein [uncultured Chitinophaga sp.]|uniref:AbiH family protein n=1 Tax=uncultured Chitinophaga sp. TaxID=339340 RepID=UPI00345973DB